LEPPDVSEWGDSDEKSLKTQTLFQIKIFRAETSNCRSYQWGLMVAACGSTSSYDIKRSQME
jgi:hypothetical protein